MDALTLARELKESVAEAGCKPAGKPRSLDDDDADEGEHHAQRQPLAHGGAAASAGGHATPLLSGSTSTFGSTASSSNASTLQAQRMTGAR